MVTVWRWWRSVAAPAHLDAGVAAQAAASSSRSPPRQSSSRRTGRPPESVSTARSRSSSNGSGAESVGVCDRKQHHDELATNALSLAHHPRRVRTHAPPPLSTATNTGQSITWGAVRPCACELYHVWWCLTPPCVQGVSRFAIVPAPPALVVVDVVAVVASIDCSAVGGYLARHLGGIPVRGHGARAHHQRHPRLTAAVAEVRRAAATMDWLLAAACWWTTTTVLALASATGLDPTGMLSSAAPAGQSIDLLDALGLYNNTRKGVERTDGPQNQRTAYLLKGDSRDLKLPAGAFEEVAQLVRHSPELTVALWVRQEVGNVGTLLSFASNGTRYLEVQSSGRRNEIRLHYTSRLDAKQYTETFHYRLADMHWHHLALSLSGSQAELLLDCHPLYKRLLQPGVPERNFTAPTRLWLGQREKHFHFRGAMQDVRVIGGPHGYLRLCPSLDSSCPTCGQFSLLQSTVQELTRHLQELSERLAAAESRVTRLEDCDCQKSCRLNGTAYQDGARWQQGCDLCTCVHGEVQCRPVECPELKCKNPVNKTGECCQICLRHCYFYGVFYDHGDQVHVKQCVECECMDGSMKCTNIDPEEQCPKLTCPPEEQITVPGECCKFCPGVDYCAMGHICHANASCLNLQTTYACHCDQGFHGDGHTCSDIDECQQEGGLEGHHCHLNTRCKNTRGSYECECLEGYRRVDAFNCAEVDECTEVGVPGDGGVAAHSCSAHAHCVNTAGSYRCVCAEGYTGDGRTCTPVCNPKCLNSGLCRRPGECACRPGFTGARCERDLDECASPRLHRCTDSSLCVNMIGWYYCACKPGYESIFTNNNLGTLCEDVDECTRGLHSCHPTAKCVNERGGYRCTCPAAPLTGDSPDDRNLQPECRLSCMFEGQEVADGAVYMPADRTCVRCTCTKGVIACVEPKCDCTSPELRRSPCCPQCDPALSCSHQELPEVVLMHGERWSYQCQTCECLRGEVDCWDLMCPQLPCKNPIQEAGDCCPRCGDLCPFPGNTSLALGGGEPCTLEGRYYESGARFADPNDPCTACNCQDGVLCCSYNLDCDDGGAQHTLGAAISGDTTTSSATTTAIQQSDYTRQYGTRRHRGAAVANKTEVEEDTGDG